MAQSRSELAVLTPEQLRNRRRRNIAIPSVTALVDFVQRTVSPPDALGPATRRSAIF